MKLSAGSRCGVIMAGNPKLRVDRDFQEAFFYGVFLYAPLIMLAAAVLIIIIHMFTANGLFDYIGDMLAFEIEYLFNDGATIISAVQENPFRMVWRFFLVGFFLLIAGMPLCMDDVLCPNCKHYFVLKRCSDFRYAGERQKNVSRTYDVNDVATSITSRGDIIVTNIRQTNTQDGIETTRQFKYNKKCTCCGCVVRMNIGVSTTQWN